MKKIFFLFALLASITASAAVTVTPLSVDYSAKKVTFSVSWPGDAAERVWVWIDLSPITGTSPSTFEKAEIGGATATTGSIETVSGNTRGFYVTTNPSTVTATLSDAPSKFNWCAYGSDYPPNVLANTNGSYTLAGTPPFTLIASNGTTMQTVNGATIATADVTMTPATITDATGYPGLWCPYTGNDLYMDTTHRCRQRQSGAQNWEAWIKDTRDEELYRIVLMPDDKWWLAQNVKYARAGTAHNSCDKDECGRYYTRAEANAAYESGTGGSNIRTQGVCPYNWLLPLGEDWKSLHVSLGNDVATTLSALRAIDSKCEPVYDTYGWAAKVELRVAAKLSNISGYYQNNLGNPSLGLIMDVKVLSLSAYEDCGSILLASNGSATAPAMVRCFRQL